MAEARTTAEEGAPAAATEEVHAQDPVEEPPTTTEEDSEQGEIKEDDAPTEQQQRQQETQQELSRRYRWCKCACDPSQYAGVDHYFLHMDSQQSAWEEPSEPYWTWNAEKQAIDEIGLQHSRIPIPNSAATINPDTTDDTAPDPEYTGYNPKIHGNYDPNAPYAQYHNQKRREEWFTEHGYDPATAAAAAAGAAAVAVAPQPENADYTSAGTFNRFTGAFQNPEQQNADRYSASNKAGRQLNAFFDPDEAMNQHDGRSLKDERRKQKLSKKQIQEHNEKKKARKHKRMMDFYKS